ncbi:hypothetical protein KFL_002190610 [Klebsormidium nitens]|uniref:RING-type domain-containing protein n=1 Tax=Klebsormidium nitens TaxID=105231 RepID=A0A1Y1I6R1_KLENI|nr:hypothetical protein KFL_002190610 [Klebsormidium nitens]|eukprot:GAQ85109.1 hypothetical protein KFL_002190610 [Klebsormidium nitens]
MASTDLTALSPRAPHPRVTTGKVTLKPHQLAMIHRCAEIEATCDVLVMNDKPGAGKTYAILGCLLRRKEEIGGRCEATIIFVPHHILTQWQESIRDLIGISMRTFSLEYGHIDIILRIAEDHDIILAPSTLCSSVANALKAAHASIPRVVMDEALALDILYAPVPARKVWYISGDHDLAQHVERNWRPNSMMVSRCDENFVASSFHIEDPLVVDEHCTSPLLEKVLIPSVGGSAEARERLNEMDFFHMSAPTVRNEKELIQALLQYTRTSRESNAATIQDCQHALSRNPNPVQQGIYENLIRDCTAKLRASDALVGNITGNISANDLCVACLEKLDRQRFIAPCGHKLCGACGGTCLVVCPLCRTAPDGVPNRLEVAAVGEEDKIPNKLECLFRLVTDRGPTAKILIFSKHVRIYRTIQEEFRARGVTYADLEGGSQARIDEVVRSFKERDTKVLMVDSSLFACGLNIENTTDVIMLHKMDEQTERQVNMKTS